MCLVSKWRFPRKAKENIVCFKVLRKSAIIRYWATPFQGVRVQLNNMLIAEKCKKFSVFHPFVKGEGYIHAYSQKDFVINNIFSTGNIFVAVIPKGTKYHISKDGKQICAEKMFITSEQYD